LADPFQPPVLRLLRLTLDAARAVGIEVAVCGEMAADPLATPLLLGLGVEEFSVSAHLIPELKTSIARWTLPEARRRAEAALAADSAAGVRRILGEPPGEP
jgi:phosphocarrier protein FPr